MQFREKSYINSNLIFKKARKKFLSVYCENSNPNPINRKQKLENANIVTNEILHAIRIRGKIKILYLFFECYTKQRKFISSFYFLWNETIR